MKRLYFFVFFVLNFILAFGSKGTSVDISTTARIINPTSVVVKKAHNSQELNFKLDNLKEDEVKVYIKELGDINLYNKKNIEGKLALDSNQKRATVRVIYN